VTTLLFFHLLGAFLFFSGGVVAGVLHLAAMRRDRPSEVALLLGLTRWGAAAVGLGALMTLGFGLGLAADEHVLGAGWVGAAIGLWVVAMALGGLGGRPLRHARELAERLGDEPSEELRRAVADRRALVLNWLSFAALLAIVVLMVFKPGG
jgi:uncharacterized membrane protein